MKTARFFHFSPAGEAVKISIREGQTLRHLHATETEEGWSSEANEWTFDGDTLISRWLSDGRDCDGRLQQSGESFCPVSDLRAGYVDEDGIAFPKWEAGETSQRDYSAEAMGY